MAVSTHLNPFFTFTYLHPFLPILSTFSILSIWRENLPLCSMRVAHHRQRSGVGGWKAPALPVPAPTDALVGISIPHVVGGRLSLKFSLAGKPLEFEFPDNGGAGGSRAQASRFQGRRGGIRRDDCPRVRE